MQVDVVPPIVFVFFAIGFLAALGVIGCMLLLAKRIGANPFSASISDQKMGEMTKFVWAGSDRLKERGLFGLVWAIRVLFLVAVIMVAAFAFVLAGAAS